MHSSSQEQRATHIRFSQEVEELRDGPEHGASSGSMEAGNRPTNKTKSTTMTTVPLRPQQQPFGASTRSPLLSPPPSRPVGKSSSLFRSNPPAKPTSIDAQNYQSAVRRAENPLYASMTPTAGEGAGLGRMALGAVRESSTESGMTTKPAKFAQQTIAHSLNGARTIEQERQYSARPPPSPSRSFTSPNSQSRQKQRHFAISPKSPYQPRLSFGTPSPSSRKGCAISVTAPNSTSWAGRDHIQGRKVKDDDEEEVDEVAQIRIADCKRRGGGGVLEDTGAKPTSTTTKVTTAAAVGMIKQSSVAQWWKQDVKELIDSVASKVSAKKDEDDDEDGFEADWLDEKSLSELTKDLDNLDEKEKEDDGYRKREKERERAYDKDRGQGPQGSGKVTSSSAAQAMEKEEKQTEKKLVPEPDFPYSDDEGPHVLGLDPVSLVSISRDTIAKESGANVPVVKEYIVKEYVAKEDVAKEEVAKEYAVKCRDHEGERELEWERERRQKVDRDRDGQRSGSSTAAKSPQERRKSGAMVSRRSYFLPSDISSGDDSLQSPGRQSSSVRRVNGTSSSGKASQEGTKNEVKVIKAPSFSLSDISSDEELQQSQRQQQTSKPSRKPESKTPLEDILRNLSSFGQDNRPSTPTRSIYNPKNSNLNRSIDAPDSDSDLDDAPFSITATQSQSDLHTPSSCSTSGSLPLSQAPSITSMDSFSSMIAHIGGSGREQETERMRKKPTSFVDLDDSSLDDDDNPFLEHTISRAKSMTSSNKVGDESGTLVLKKREEEPRNFVDSCRHQDRQQQDQHKRNIQSQRSKDDGGFGESIGRRKQVDSNRTRPNKPEKVAEDIPRHRNVNGTRDTRRSEVSSVRRKMRIHRDDDQGDHSGNGQDSTLSHLAEEPRGGETSNIMHKDRSIVSSGDRERTRRSDGHRVTERGYSNSQKDDRDRRRDRDRDQHRDQDNDRESAVRPIKSSVEWPTRITIKQEQPLDDPLSVLLTPTDTQRRTPKADQIWSGKKRRTRPGISSDEETDSSRSRPTTPEPITRTATKKQLEKPPSTPTKGMNGRRSELDGVKRQGLESPKKSPRFGDDFKLPSPRRKRVRSIAEMMSLSDDDYPSTGETFSVIYYNQCSALT